MIKTLSQLAQDALNAQGAVNLSGMAHSLVNDVFPSLRAAGVNDTDALNTHPVVQLFVTQMCWLSDAGTADPVPYRKAYEWCVEAAAG